MKPCKLQPRTQNTQKTKPTRCKPTTYYLHQEACNPTPKTKKPRTTMQSRLMFSVKKIGAWDYVPHAKRF
jgi:hypothetical protein